MYQRGYGWGPGGGGCGPWGRRGGWPGGRQAQSAPVNITESDQEYTIKLFAPSLNKEQIKLTTQNDTLTVRYEAGERTDDSQFTRKEYHQERFERSFDLKGKVNVADISARYAEGVLTIVLPKSDAAKKPAQDVPVN